MRKLQRGIFSTSKFKLDRNTVREIYNMKGLLNIHIAGIRNKKKVLSPLGGGRTGFA